MYKPVLGQSPASFISSGCPLGYKRPKQTEARFNTGPCTGCVHEADKVWGIAGVPGMKRQRKARLAPSAHPWPQMNLVLPTVRAKRHHEAGNNAVVTAESGSAAGCDGRRSTSSSSSGWI
ncbi:hypothetical protein H112_07348 [Trichophyton rubrum D6]|uniref:Uncharacterized protein n=2 Tax=Trichophyton rubrum TaxID=5551 RepID=F2SII0_TRIRC|nr:uncharacterized protein TERG_02668 [Trichophyton rubrum CBS 118892]EZF11535.1 hypothetical protein H100_07375 [Trichophyton rubrum MR850]EZF38459.1 hypothetical protein H102_07336 [Trichophyton rubrum CBS 100081]EZF49050.1 hypothetical protein H103_07359 [Trichophyton rubrum CBS 288.86]EZF59681.1 hypothetical protein H104_07311 [Trichophyton rubrum CBS 289.86]EZF80967.1 hypothetical protein H110_07357 [Trichophyton rubrum MR1448]EZF91644.1 hypothetical protein H113_07411 [Trichophyton rubr